MPALLLSALLQVALTAGDDLSVEAPDVTVGQVYDLSALAEPARSRTRSLTLFRFAPRETERTLDAGQLAALLRRRVPGLEADVPGAPRQVRFHRPSSTVMPADGGACGELRTAIEAGALIRRSDLRPVPCGDDAVATRLAYERATGALRATEAMAAGARLGRIAPPRYAVDRGAALTLVARAGPVRIERDVRAAQPGRSGRAMFVTDAEGHSFAVPLAQLEDGDATP